jgi:lysophospholipase
MRSLTLNNSVSNWPTCLACAFTDRAFDYTSSNRSAECQECFNTWCWNGEDDQSQPSGEYEPVMGTKPSFLVSSNLTSGDNSPVNAAQPNAPTNAAQTSDTGAATPNYGAGMIGVGALAVGMIWSLI